MIPCHTNSDVLSTPRRIAVLGASGSIGGSALEVIASSGGKLKAEILTVHTDTEKLVRLACQFRPSTVVITGREVNRAPLADLPAGTEILFGQEKLEAVVQRPEVDVVLSAIVGSAGLASTRSALEAGKTVALANKESLVVGGSLLMNMLRDRHAGRIIPVDSEHSAIYQCLLARCLLPSSSGDNSSNIGDNESGNARPDHRARFSEEVAQLILTASGGPFRTWPKERLQTVTPADALAHPTWSMGKKVTIDSATMMNKALEIVEAHWLFGMESERIGVMIHPQSIIHSMVEFIDGTVMAQLACPDMRLPIQLALDDHGRFDGPSRRIDWTQAFSLELIPPDPDRFPALDLGHEMARRGGTAGVVVNAANEVAVTAFLQGQLSFDKIVTVCQTVLENHHYEASPTFQRLLELDQWARKETEKWISL